MSKITTEQLAELLFQSKAGRVTRKSLQDFLKGTYSVRDEQYRMKEDKRTAQKIYNSVKCSGNFHPITSENHDEGEWTAHLISFNRDIESQEVLDYFAEHGLSVPTIKKVLSFGQQHYFGKITDRFSLIALSDLSISDDAHCISQNDGRRNFNTTKMLCSGWNKTCLFLAVEKA